VQYPKATSYLTVAGISFFLGSFLTTYAFSRARRTKKLDDRENAGATREFNDLSIFYGDEDTLTTIERNNSHLPETFYAQYVHNCIVSCVDCVIVRADKETGDKQCILVERRDNPAKGKWWFPGGRQFKGETFFRAAERKTRTETGLKGTATQVLGVWNTFFDTSAWDVKGVKGTQTVNVAVYIEVPDGSEVFLDNTSDRFRWISMNPDCPTNRDEEPFVISTLRRVRAYNKTFNRKEIFDDVQQK
jgi:colanic acid biosynthesis protein WcaH